MPYYMQMHKKHPDNMYAYNITFKVIDKWEEAMALLGGVILRAAPNVPGFWSVFKDKSEDGLLFDIDTYPHADKVRRLINGV